MQKIVPCLWMAQEVDEAVQFYRDTFGDAKVLFRSTYPTQGLPEFQKPMAGQPLVVHFSVSGFEFMALNGGSTQFKPTPSLSFMVNFDPSRDERAREHLDQVWARLHEGGTALMPLQAYDFSPYYGWVQDKYGFNWQLILTNPEGEPRPFILPALMFGGSAQNRANEAIDFYTSVFADSRRGNTYPYGQAVGPALAHSVMFADFVLEGQWFVANDSGVEQDFTFTEAVSLLVNCADQAEIDRLWEAMSARPDSEQCGWLKDKFGVSWQICPANLDQHMTGPDGSPRLEVYQAMLGMKKLVIDDLGV